jgi:hypothetical protein
MRNLLCLKTKYTYYWNAGVIWQNQIDVTINAGNIDISPLLHDYHRTAVIIT